MSFEAQVRFNGKILAKGSGKSKKGAEMQAAKKALEDLKQKRGKSMKHQYIIPIFVPHLGCPNDCIFCNQKSISGQKKNMTKEEAKKIIDNYLKNVKDDQAQIEIAFFGGSFTAIEEKLQNELLELAYEYVKKRKSREYQNIYETRLY